MNILVTGAKGFVGRNLCENLKNIRDGKNRTRPALNITDIFEYDLDTAPALLDEYCAKADFVFNLAGVNRPKVESEFMAGNFGFSFWKRRIFASRSSPRNRMTPPSGRSRPLSSLTSVVLPAPFWPMMAVGRASSVRLISWSTGVPGR